MQASIQVSCEVTYHLIGFDGIGGYYTPKEFEKVYDCLKEYNTDISHEIYEGTAIDEEGFTILVVITIINLDK